MIIKLIPIISVIILGYILTRVNFLNDSMVENLKKLVVNVTLPIGLFSSFIKIRFEIKYIFVFIAIYLTCLILLYTGKLIAKIFKITNQYFPFMLTGFEAGMIGYTLFTVAYGSNMYSVFGIVDIGQVSFVFTIMVPMILMINSEKNEQRPLIMSAKTALKSPVIWAIILGLSLSILGIWKFEGTRMYEIFDNIFNVISTSTSFLICLVIGNGIKLSFKGMKLELVTNLIRIVVTLLFAIIINQIVFNAIEMDDIYVKALFTMFILPAPFVIPAFMQNPSEEDESYVANTLSIGTVFGLLGFIIITIIM